MQLAFDEQERSGALEGHREWIRSLLVDYYDPMYAYQLGKREGRRLVTGDRATVSAFVRGELLDA
jgi:tRNA 2-selenouridine synthase